MHLFDGQTICFNGINFAREFFALLELQNFTAHLNVAVSLVMALLGFGLMCFDI